MMNINYKKIIILVIILIIMLIPTESICGKKKVLLGDIDCNGMIDILDVSYVLKHISASSTNKHPDWILTGTKLKLADIDKNGEIDILDISKIFKYKAATDSTKIKNKHPEWLTLIKEIEVDIEEEDTTQNIEVTEKTPATKINLTKMSNIDKTSTTELNKDEVGNISAIIEPGGAKKEDVEWTSNAQDKIAIERIIDNGTYYIKSALGSDMVIDINGGSKENKAKVQLHKSNKTDAQKFIITNVGNEYYTIKAKHSGKMLDVTGKGTEKGTKVQQYSKGDTDAQKWEFEYAGNGYYYIRSKCNGLYLDVKDGKATNGAQIQVWTENRSKSQKFKLEQISKTATLVETGTYYIKSALNENKVLDVTGGSTENKALIQIHDSNKTEAQKFEIVSLGNNYYVIRSAKSGKVLELANGDMKKKTKIQQYDYNGTEAQIWKIEKSGGYYRFKSKKNGLYIDLPDGKTANGNKIQMWTSNTSKAQKFKLEKESTSIKYANIEYVTLKAKKGGTATVTATLLDGKKVTATIKVNASVTSLKLNKTKLELDIDKDNTENKSVKTFKLVVTILPEKAENKTIKWTSSNTKVAIVDQNGKVTAKGVGTTIITATSNNGKTAKSKVTVTKFPTKYIEHMRQKIKWYESKGKGYIKNNWACLVDIKNTHLTIFNKKNNKWELKLACNCILGTKDKNYVSLAGPRAWTGRGVFHIKGRWYGTQTGWLWAQETTNSNPGAAVRFHPSNYGEPDNFAKDKRWKSHGCCNLSYKDAKWIYNNVPDGSTVICFDEWNYMPTFEEHESNYTNRTHSKDIPWTN